MMSKGLYGNGRPRRVAAVAMAAAIGLAGDMAGGAFAQAPAPLDANPSECAIRAALLGTSGADCPPVTMNRPPPPPSENSAEAPPVATALVETAIPTLPTVGLRADFRIGFALNSARITPESRTILDRLGAVMAAPDAGNTRFRIVGHTDARGGDALNMALSKRRADAVAHYLIETRGIAPARLETVGMSSREPSNPTDPHAAENRRVEIVNLGK